MILIKIIFEIIYAMANTFDGEGACWECGWRLKHHKPSCLAKEEIQECNFHLDQLDNEVDRYFKELPQLKANIDALKNKKTF